MSAHQTKFMRRFGFLVAMIGLGAPIGSFVPAANLGALILAIVGLCLGMLCLILDRRFNLPAFAGTLISSAAVSMSIIMGFIYF